MSLACSNSFSSRRLTASSYVISPSSAVSAGATGAASAYVGTASEAGEEGAAGEGAVDEASKRFEREATGEEEMEDFEIPLVMSRMGLEMGAGAAMAALGEGTEAMVGCFLLSALAWSARGRQ